MIDLVYSFGSVAKIEATVTKSFNQTIHLMNLTMLSVQLFLATTSSPSHATH